MRSIRRDLLTRLLLGLLAVLGIAGAALYARTRTILLREYDETLRSKAAALISLTKQHAGQVELDFADEVMPEFERAKRPAYFQLWLPDGQTVERSPSLHEADLSRQMSDGVRNVVLPDGRPGRAMGVRFVPQPAEEENESSAPPVAPVLTLVVTSDRIGLNRTLSGLQAGLLLVGALVLASTALVVAMAVRRGLAPLDTVSRQAEAINASSLQTRFATAHLPVELRPIGERLNDLLARLDEAFQRERRFSADVAHELRTSIAELRSLSEVGLKWPDEPVPLGDILAVAQKMETIVAGLLTLARCEEGKQPIALEPVAIDALVEELWAPLAARAQRNQLVVTLDIPHDLRLTSDRTLLRLILANLLANAVEYTPVRGGVQISAGQRDGRFQLTVANTTDDLSKGDVPHLFERFWRKDPARTGGEHSGLGLSVARAGAAALGFDLVAELREPGKLGVTLTGIVTRT